MSDTKYKKTIEGELNKEGASLFFDEKAYRKLFKDKPPEELERIIRRERISGFIQTIMSEGNQNEKLLKAVAAISTQRNHTLRKHIHKSNRGRATLTSKYPRTNSFPNPH